MLLGVVLLLAGLMGLDPHFESPPTTTQRMAPFALGALAVLAGGALLLAGRSGTLWTTSRVWTSMDRERRGRGFLGQLRVVRRRLSGPEPCP